MLWVKTNGSFLEGASDPEELIDECHHLGLRAIAITDRDGMYGIVRAHIRAMELGIRIVIGTQMTLDDGSNIVLLAQTREGYANLCRLITVGRLRHAKGECSVQWHEVFSHQAGVIALWGGPQSLLVRPREPKAVIRGLKKAFGDRLYAMVVRHRRVEEAVEERRLRSRAHAHGIPMVAATEVLYHSPARRDLQDVLTCIRHGVKLSEAGRKLRPNAEYALKSEQALRALFRDDIPLVQRAFEVLGRCHFSLSEIQYRYPSERLPDGSTSSQWLRELTARGAQWRYAGSPLQASSGAAETPFDRGPEETTLNGPPDFSGIPDDVSAQLTKELNLIDELEYCGYFLTMWEIVRFCRQHDILCQGRGSAANSIVCYCLGITAIDPVRMDLLFERFLSRERAEPPDIDLDIEHNRREEVIQHVYAKYGRTHAAMVANVIRYRPRSAVREVGKVLGIAETALDRVAKLLGYHGDISPGDLHHAGLDPEHPTHAHLLRLTNELLDFPRHLSIHPGGFLLGHEPVHDLVPIENATMADRTVIQWDKYDVEALGLFKVDLLGLGALHQLHLAFDQLREERELDITMATIPHEDPDTYAMIQKADTLGTFQIESRAQMAMLPRLKPQTFYDLVIEVSIVRPGPITGGMVHPYLRRRAGEEPVQYPHECLEPVLAKTLGVPLFQEQVMKLAVVAADYTPGEADQLRRDMAAWRKSGRIEKHRERLVQRMVAKGIAEEFAQRVFEQIRGFGEYGFPESHAASFALIAYATAWLRCHHIDIFTCSLLNAQPMGFYSPATIVEDAKRHGVTMLPIDARASTWDCALEPDPGDGRYAAVRMGLRYVKGLPEADANELLDTRAKAPFLTIEDLVERTSLNERALVKLAESGAFSSLGISRRESLWQVRGLIRNRDKSLALSERDAPPAFAALDAFETISWDYRTASHSPRGHPLEPLRDQLRRHGLPTAIEVQNAPDGRRIHYAGLVICRQRPGTASGVVFMTMEDETGFVNLVVWPQVFEEYAILARTTAFLGVTGRIQSEAGIVHLIADKLWAPKLEAAVDKPNSRDFH